MNRFPTARQLLAVLVLACVVLVAGCTGPDVEGTTSVFDGEPTTSPDGTDGTGSTTDGGFGDATTTHRGGTNPATVTTPGA